MPAVSCRTRWEKCPCWVDIQQSAGPLEPMYLLGPPYTLLRALVSPLLKADASADFQQSARHGQCVKGLERCPNPVLSAYAGVAVLSVMLVTTVLVSLVMLVVWEKPVWLVLPFFLIYFALEGLYFSATICKVIVQTPAGCTRRVASHSCSNPLMHLGLEQECMTLLKPRMSNCFFDMVRSSHAHLFCAALWSWPAMVTYVCVRWQCAPWQ
jgi:hypothetical protein